MIGPGKKPFRASEPERPEILQERRAFQQLQTQLAPEDVIGIDEMGANLSLVRLYARAPKGQRAYASKPVNRGRNITTIGALGLEGLVAVMTVEGSTTGEVFQPSIDQRLVPRLRPGQVVLMDNLRAHKVRGIQESIEATGARLQYLPPYSPDFSPIEPCWAKRKTFLRAQAARTREALDTALTDGLKRITPADARGWFKHCGYRIIPN